ncbi:OSJNBb0022F23.8-like protein, partial [Zea mays]
MVQKFGGGGYSDCPRLIFEATAIFTSSATDVYNLQTIQPLRLVRSRKIDTYIYYQDPANKNGGKWVIRFKKAVFRSILCGF